MSSSNKPEPWLRGPLDSVHPLIAPVFFSFAQVREDLAKHLDGINDDAVWKDVNGSSLGFHLKHIARSVDRLTTYLMDRQLSESQLAELRTETEPDATLQELLREIDRCLHVSEEQLSQLNPTSLYDRRSVGRHALPATVIGLIVHLCEHTQRHLGQAITLAKMLK